MSAADDELARRRADRIGTLLPPDRDHAVSYRVAEADDDPEPTVRLRTPVTWGIVVVVLGFGGFFGWAASASLDSASVATGTLVVDSKRKTIGHLEGGILERLLVSEGDVVAAGQPLLEMDDTRARADLAQLRGKRIGFLARLARLKAEQDGLAAVDFPPELKSSADPIAALVVSAETKLFDKRREVYRGKLDYQHRQFDQFVAEADALQAQIESNVRQKELIGTRLEAVRELAAKGYASKALLVEIEARWSELGGNIGEFTAQKAKAEQAKAGVRVALASVETEWQSDVASQLQDAQLGLNEVDQQIASSEDVLRRLELRSPQDGVVVDVRVRTPGGVIAPGEPIMDIVPEHEPLLVEARLNLRDIVDVHVGTPVRVRLTSYNHRTLAPVAGTVAYVAADQTVDEASGTAFYIVRARLAPEALVGHPEVSLVPGMPAELLVLKRPRKALDYLIEPITESFNRAFRES